MKPRPKFRMVYIMPTRVSRAVRAALGLPPAPIGVLFVPA